MKKTLSMLLALCLLCACCAAGTAETAAPLVYDQNGFSVTIPVEWVFGYSEDDATAYFAQITGSTNNAMLMFIASRDDSLADTELSEDDLMEMYQTMLEEAGALSQDGKVNYLYSEIAGHPSILYDLRQDIGGTVCAVAYDVAIIDGWTFGIIIVHADSDPDALADYLDTTIGTAVQYAPKPAVSLEDLPTKDNPYQFVPSIANNQNYVTPMWMIDESTRAMCTLLLSLGLDLSHGSLDSSYPMDIYASYIGSEDDTIRTIMPSADRTLGYVLEYDTVEGTALFWGVPWNEETLAEFEASCPDQYYENTEEALNYVVQILMSTVESFEE